MKPLLQFKGLDAVQLPDKPLHLAVGMFDGLHLGHREVIAKAVQAAQGDKGISGALTFWPHPSALFRPDDPTRQIMTPGTKAKVMATLQVDVIITESFTPEFAGITAEKFLSEILRQIPQLTAIYVGENWRFGRGRLGDVSMLKQTSINLGIKVVSVARVRTEDDETISSTNIRSLIESGRIAQANLMLGDPYFAEGRIIPGKGLGRQLGFPTLNLNWTPELILQNGVYAVRVSRAGDVESLQGVANYGVRPTVEDASEPRLEVHVLGDCSLESGDDVTVELLHFLRPEQKFSDERELKSPIAVDRADAIHWFASA